MPTAKKPVKPTKIEKAATISPANGKALSIANGNAVSNGAPSTVKRGDIFIKGARTHNLKNIDVLIPRNELIVVTGVSGSGKSSLAFDTLYAEGHRRYVESLSSYIRQFLERMPKPDIDYITGVAPAIAIEQKTISKNPRSTVGTVTEIYDYLRLLFARVGKTYSSDTNELVLKESPEDALTQLKLFENGTKIFIAFPFPHHTKGGEDGKKQKESTLAEELQNLKQKGFLRILCDDEVLDLSNAADEKTLLALPKKSLSELLVLIDRLVLKHTDELYGRIIEAVETAFGESGGYCAIKVITNAQQKLLRFSDKFELNGIEYETPSPQMFAFNSPVGACTVCQGFGRVAGVDEDLVVPNRALSIRDGAVACWNSDKHSRNLRDLIRIAPKYKIPIDVPYSKLPAATRKLIWDGLPKEGFAGITLFFKEVEREGQYKMHYRVLLNRYRGYSVCPNCGGSRLRKDALYVKVGGKTIFDIVQMTIGEAHLFLRDLEISRFDKEVATTILTELTRRLGYLVEVGLEYLSLNRPSQTLSGGESQRINLATSLGSSLVGSMYILDEPSIGLHQRDSARLIEILRKLRNLGNTVLVVEHDREIMEAADTIIDLGPAAGRLGGHLIFHGTYKELLEQPKSLTAKYLRDKHAIPVPPQRREVNLEKAIAISGAMENNLKNIDTRFPLGVMTCVTGVSGSGKSTLVNDILYLGLQKQKVGTAEKVGTHQSLSGASLVDKVELIDQSPIGRTSRSNPATYLKLFDDVRILFSQTQLAKMKGWDAGHFSFNIPGGRCETCAGEGIIRVEMQFLADIETVCETCRGKRYQTETLEATYKSKSIADVLEMTIDEAVDFFKDESTAPKSVLKSAVKKLKVLQEVGLGYLQLGQSGSTLSGGEAQRLKLAFHIAASDTTQGAATNSLFIFDEPTTGLHFDDILKLIKCFNRLIGLGNTLVIIEHNLDVIKQADWIIDLGPEAGDRGGEIIAEGTPEDVAKAEGSYTATYLKEYLQ
ncbi:MAG: excinuclease ABC subunit UvrA [Rhizobacter sp.]|nr:excinuclease ABC subunit UvrA [Chlorobiales bacterium]